MEQYYFQVTEISLALSPCQEVLDAGCMGIMKSVMQFSPLTCPHFT